MSIFAALNVYRDIALRSAAMNMAIDEALLESAPATSIRFYRWESPALSFGYFGRFADVADNAFERDLVRRWTGGGIVFHGEDLTYSIVVPAGDRVFRESSVSIYAAIHMGLRNALIVNGQHAELAAVAAVCDRRTIRDRPVQSWEINATVTDRRYNHCFANPVRADVMLDGRKIAGAAQRRTRRGLLHQGSIQDVDLENDFAERFAQALSADCSNGNIDDTVLNRARQLTRQKYGSDVWLRKR